MRRTAFNSSSYRRISTLHHVIISEIMHFLSINIMQTRSVFIKVHVDLAQAYEFLRTVIACFKVICLCSRLRSLVFMMEML